MILTFGTCCIIHSFLWAVVGCDESFWTTQTVLIRSQVVRVVRIEAHSFVVSSRARHFQGYRSLDFAVASRVFRLGV